MTGSAPARTGPCQCGGAVHRAPELEYTVVLTEMYATTGEVSVDTSAIPNDPEASIEKMRTVIAAALAPAEPSSQDRQVAAKHRR